MGRYVLARLHLLLSLAAVPADTSKELKFLLKHLLEALTRENISAYGRDSILNLLITVVPRKSLQDPNNCLTLWVIDQGMHLLSLSSALLVVSYQTSVSMYVLVGLKAILDVGGTVKHSPGSLRVTENTQMSAAVLLNKLYGDLKCDSERENFHRLCEDYVRLVDVSKQM